MGVTANITKFELPLSEITPLLDANGGTLKLSPTPYLNELASMEQQYWKYHSPWGNPGDKLYVLEKFRVERLCQSADGYKVTYKYEDEREVSVSSPVPVAITAKGTMISGVNMPDTAIRLKLVIQDVQMTGDNWIFTLAKEVDGIEDNA